MLLDIKLLSPFTITELKPSYHESGYAIYCPLLGLIVFVCKVGELPFVQTEIDNHFGKIKQLITKHKQLY